MPRSPSEIPGYVFGGLHYPFWKFVAAISIAEAIYALGVIIAGESLLEAKPGALATTIGIMVVVAVGAGMLLRAKEAQNLAPPTGTVSDRGWRPHHHGRTGCQ